MMEEAILNEKYIKPTKAWTHHALLHSLPFSIICSQAVVDSSVEPGQDFSLPFSVMTQGSGGIYSINAKNDRGFPMTFPKRLWLGAGPKHSLSFILDNLIILTCGSKLETDWAKHEKSIMKNVPALSEVAGFVLACNFKLNQFLDTYYAHDDNFIQ